MTNPNQADETKEIAEKVYRLRQQGLTFQEMARQIGKSQSYLSQLYRRECKFRELAFEYPFIEYLTTRIQNAIKKCFGLDAFAEPERFSDPEIIRKLHRFPGVGGKVLEDLAEGLVEAGYEPFDPVAVKKLIGNRLLP